MAGVGQSRMCSVRRCLHDMLGRVYLIAQSHYVWGLSSGARTAGRCIAAGVWRMVPTILTVGTKLDLSCFLKPLSARSWDNSMLALAAHAMVHGLHSISLLPACTACMLLVHSGYA